MSVEHKGSFTVDLSRKREKEMSNAVLKCHSLLLYGSIKIRIEMCAIPSIGTLYRESISSCCKPKCKVSVPQAADVSQNKKSGTSLGDPQAPNVNYCACHLTKYFWKKKAWTLGCIMLEEKLHFDNTSSIRCH